jgi:hypothetical protein
MKIVYFSLMLITLLFITSCEYLSNSTASTAPLPETLEPYFIPPGGMFGEWKVMELKTIKNWRGNTSEDIIFKATKSPWVLNAGYASTSRIATEFQVNIWQDVKGFSGLRTGPYTNIVRKTGISAVLVEGKGTFTIAVNASGCDWWVKIGAEE